MASELVRVTGGPRGSEDGSFSEARFNGPQTMISVGDTLYVGEYTSGSIRAVNLKKKTVSTLVSGLKSLFCICSSLRNPNFLYATANSNILYRVDIALKTKIEFAGSEPGYRDATGKSALFKNVVAVACNSQGIIYVVDCHNDRIRSINEQTAVVKTVAGSSEGYRDGAVLSARFKQPSWVTVLENGNLLISDQGNHCIRLVDLTKNVVTTFAGSSQGQLDGTRDIATFNQPLQISLAHNNDIFISESTDQIRRINAHNTSGTVSGSTANLTTGSGSPHTTVSTFLTSKSHHVVFPRGITFTPNGDMYFLEGNTKDFYIYKLPNVSPPLRQKTSTISSVFTDLIGCEFVEDIMEVRHARSGTTWKLSRGFISIRCPALCLDAGRDIVEKTSFSESVVATAFKLIHGDYSVFNVLVQLQRALENPAFTERIFNGSQDIIRQFFDLAKLLSLLGLAEQLHILLQTLHAVLIATGAYIAAVAFELIEYIIDPKLNWDQLIDIVILCCRPHLRAVGRRFSMGCSMLRSYPQDFFRIMEKLCNNAILDPMSKPPLLPIQPISMNTIFEELHFSPEGGNYALYRSRFQEIEFVKSTDEVVDVGVGSPEPNNTDSELLVSSTGITSAIPIPLHSHSPLSSISSSPSLVSSSTSSPSTLGSTIFGNVRTPYPNMMVICDEEIFCVHDFVLIATWPWFYRMMHFGGQEKQQHLLLLDKDMIKPKSFRLLLEYFYTNNINSDYSTAFKNSILELHKMLEEYGPYFDLLPNGPNSNLFQIVNRYVQT